MTETEPEPELRRQAVASLKRKQKFWSDALVFLYVNGLLWVIWALTDRPSDPLPWAAWVSIFWGFFLLLDGLKAYGPWPRRPIDEAAIQREVRRLAPH